MSRNLLLLNLLLVCLCGLVGWRISEQRREQTDWQQRFLARRDKPIAPPVVMLSTRPNPASAVAYLDVAQQLLFSPDRNPTVIVDVVAPKPMPPLPRAYGYMNFGSGPRVVLAPAPGGPQRAYSPGETIGEFKLLAVSQAGLVFDWNGKQVPARFDELKDTTAPAEPTRTTAAPSSAAASSPAAAAAPQPVNASGAGQGKPGLGSGQYRACVLGDKSPEGTVADGYQKLVVHTPMGDSCRWEKVN